MINPYYSRGFIGWKEIAGATYTVEIIDQIPGAQPGEIGVIDQEVTTKNFTHIDAQYLDGNGSIIKVTARTNTGILIAEGEINSIGPAPSFSHPTCNAICEGGNYAWDLTVFRRDVAGQPGNSYKLRLSQAMESYDQATGIGVPFYEAMTIEQFNTRSAYGFPGGRRRMIVQNIQPADGVKDAGGTNISGSAWFVEKYLDQYNYMSVNSTNELFFTGSTCPSDATNLALTWNNNGAVTNQGPGNNEEPELGCTNNLGSTGNNGGGNNPGGGTGGTGEEPSLEGTECFFNAITGSNNNGLDFLMLLTDCFSNELPATGGDATLESIANPLLNTANTTTNNSGGSLGVSSSSLVKGIQIQRYDQPADLITLDPENIFKENGDFVAPNIALETGLYSMNFLFNNFTIIPVFFQWDELTSVRLTNASLTTLTVAPNPIENNTLKMSVVAQNNMSATLQLFNLNGEVFYSENIQLPKNETIDRSMLLPRLLYPYNQVRVRLSFQDGSTIEQTAIRP